MDSSLLMSLFFTGFIIVYGLFMFKLLSDVKKCTVLTKNEQNFRKFAHVISWIALVFNGIYFLIILYLIFIDYNDKAPSLTKSII